MCLGLNPLVSISIAALMPFSKFLTHNSVLNRGAVVLFFSILYLKALSSELPRRFFICSGSFHSKLLDIGPVANLIAFDSYSSGDFAMNSGHSKA